MKYAKKHPRIQFLVYIGLGILCILIIMYARGSANLSSNALKEGPQRQQDSRIQELEQSIISETNDPDKALELRRELQKYRQEQ